MNALDLALNGSVGKEVGPQSMVGIMVTAGAIMTGNSKAYIDGTTPHQWRRQAGPLFHYPAGAIVPRSTAASQAVFRRSDGIGRAVDDFDAVDDLPADLYGPQS